MQRRIHLRREAGVDLVQALSNRTLIPVLQELGDRFGVQFASRNPEAARYGLSALKQVIRERHSGFHAFSITQVIPPIGSFQAFAAAAAFNCAAISFAFSSSIVCSAPVPMKRMPRAAQNFDIASVRV